MLRLLTHMRDPDFLRAYTFTQPIRIPIRFEVNYACLEAYDLKELRKLVSRHSLLFKDHERGFLDPRQRQPAPWLILELLDDLIACGVTVINLQDRVNGIDEIGKRCKGRIAIDLDIDRQEVTRNGSPKDVEELIREAVAKLSGPRGGLSLVYDLYPGIPIRNVDAVMRAMEEYSTIR